jgi:hypothetical protein
MRESLRVASTSPSPPRKHLFRHPNKHHEGDRRRWEARIEAEEVRRYEGVWVVNSDKDPNASGASASEKRRQSSSEMIDVVVRELWSRSGLSNDVLAEVWDLVDDRRVNRLTREQFIVGMWLIGRKLDGKELPHRVPESLWLSVTPFISSTGVSIRFD